MTNLSQIDLNKILIKYINFGWVYLKEIFYSHRVAKEKKFKKTVNPYLIHLMNGIRTYLFEELFNSSNPKNICHYISFGNKNLISDYDLNILGKNAPKVLIDTFVKFYKIYGQTLSYSFDINMYCNGFYAMKYSNNIPQKLIVNQDIFTIVPKTKMGKSVSIQFALLKLLEAGLDISTINKSYLESSNTLRKKLLNEFETYKPKFIKNNSELIKKYELMYKYSLETYKYLYSPSYLKITPSDFFYNLGCALYFSIESYYSICTVNVVVLNMQGKKKLKLDKINYICSLIENLGDFNKHYQEILHQKNKKLYTEKNILLILSKYIYRIYYSLSALEKITYNLKDIEELVQKRNIDDIDIDKINFSCIGFASNLESYMKKVNKDIIEKISFYIL